VAQSAIQCRLQNRRIEQSTFKMTDSSPDRTGTPCFKNNFFCLGNAKRRSDFKYKLAHGQFLLIIIFIRRTKHEIIGFSELPTYKLREIGCKTTVAKSRQLLQD
jgi:hypothetical protein